MDVSPALQQLVREGLVAINSDHTLAERVTISAKNLGLERPHYGPPKPIKPVAELARQHDRTTMLWGTSSTMTATCRAAKKFSRLSNSSGSYRPCAIAAANASWPAAFPAKASRGLPGEGPGDTVVGYLRGVSADDLDALDSTA